ncbi:MAG: NifU family protein, partial [Pseudomonadota bacterium]
REVRPRIPIHNPDFGEPENKAGPKVDRENLSPELQNVEEILDRTIRPGLQADGGDVEVIKKEDNEIYILYQGACGGCPSSMMGTLDAIQSILRHELSNPEISVIPI